MRRGAIAVDARLGATVDAVRERTDFAPSIGVVLDHTHHGFAARLKNAVVIPYATLPHMAIATSESSGSLVLGYVDDVRVACLVGRIRLGEAAGAWQVVHGVRVLARLGVTTALVTEAAGLLEPTWNVGDSMMVTDHLNLATHEGLGCLSDDGFVVFPDMRAAYDDGLRAELDAVASTEERLSACLGTARASVDLVKGVYAGLPDPSYETAAQMRMLRSMGAQAVGTGTALEVVALRQLGVRTAALAQLAYRAIESDTCMLEDEVTVRTDDGYFQKLLRGWIIRARRQSTSAQPITFTRAPAVLERKTS